jgi:hypothetical protein
MPTRIRVATVKAIDSVAPHDQLKLAPDWSAMMLPHIMPLGPPTSRGVT